MPTVEVEWETDGQEVDLPQFVNVPSDVYESQRYDIGDNPVAEWLSDQYGWLVYGWRLKGCNYQ